MTREYECSNTSSGVASELCDIFDRQLMVVTYVSHVIKQPLKKQDGMTKARRRVEDPAFDCPLSV